MINIGDMNKKIEIYGFGWDKDELGQKIRKEKLIARVWAKAVSYTHLDVYKRQDKRRKKTRINFIRKRN